MEVHIQFHAPAPLIWGNIALYPLYRRLINSQTRSGLCGGNKTLFPLPGIEPYFLSSSP
jgi:hypothetical protein